MLVMYSFSVYNVLLYVSVLGVKSAIYHAGLAKTVRRRVHQRFINDEIQVRVNCYIFLLIFCSDLRVHHI